MCQPGYRRNSRRLKVFDVNLSLTEIGSDCMFRHMNQGKTTRCSLKTLCEELAGCRVTKSPFFPDFSLEALMAEVTACRIIKESHRRQIFYLQTPAKGYFLKRSTLVRSKDRRRHFLLPFRKWSEWRNLHSLLKAEIPAARPVLKGENKASHPAMFFLLTEKVDGSTLKINSGADAWNLGEYAAVLHSHGVWHADLHPHNIILKSPGQFWLIDVQELFFLPWIPRWLRVQNLAKIYFNSCFANDHGRWPQELLEGYHQKSSTQISLSELLKAAGRHQKKKYRSRSKRCCKNSSEFVVVKSNDLRGYKRREFQWGARDLRQALQKGESLKAAHVIYHQGICIKKHRRKLFHRNRCMASWKMSRALEVRNIPVPRSLGYFVMKEKSYFLSELVDGRLHLNTYLSAISDERTKRMALRKLALWLRKFHDTHVWQRDFKSSNILCQNGEYFMVDLDGVRIRRLSEQNKIVNLAQLNASVSNAITIKDRLRFYHYYATGHQPTRQKRRAVYSKVWDITRTKNTAIYNLDLEKL